jgi:polyisoprenoid-binding protein YceI
MPRYDASSAQVLVFTFKEGLLSAAAHDLKLEVTKFTVDVEGTSVRAELDATSLRMVTPMKDGRENEGSIPRMLYGEIEKNTATAVLDVARYPGISFVSTQITETEVIGRLTLHGQTKDVKGRRSGASAEFSFDQRDFGIKPYSAMLGTLKVKPVLTVKVTLPTV